MIKINREENDMSIKVIVAGFKGRMGSTAVEMVKGDDELTLAALLDPFATEKKWTVFLSSQIKRIWLALTQMSGGFHYASCCL